VKCKGCGANYKTKDIVCPYCGTENILGIFWNAERRKAELEYERKRKEMGKLFSKYVINRILSRTIVILVFILLISFITIQVFDVAGDTYEEQKRDETVLELEKLYSEGKLNELTEIALNRSNLTGKDMYPYIQAGLINSDYNSYLNSKYLFLDSYGKDKVTNEYDLRKSIEYSIDVYILNLGLYNELHERNQELYNTYCKEIESYWTSILKMSPEDIEYITKNRGASFDLDGIVEKIKRRI